jgi:hypothetical protein
VINKPGYAHIAFAVQSVAKALEKAERNGGGRVGKMVSAEIEGVGRSTSSTVEILKETSLACRRGDEPL